MRPIRTISVTILVAALFAAAALVTRATVAAGLNERTTSVEPVR
jgi:hypothetical protein